MTMLFEEANHNCLVTHSCAKITRSITCSHQQSALYITDIINKTKLNTVTSYNCPQLSPTSIAEVTGSGNHIKVSRKKEYEWYL